MKKKGLLFLVMMLLAITLKTQAATYSSYLPGGKNYLNPENFRLRNDTIESIEAFKVKPNQTYTLTYPGDDMFFASYLTIGGTSGASYADGAAINLPVCSVTQNEAICTFTTASNESALFLRITSPGTTQFYNHYRLGEIQLEEGSSSTSFAPYVAPSNDEEEPSFAESGAFILSYKDQTPIETIINNHITVYDEIDGDLSDQIVIESDAYTPNQQQVGSYIVRLSATDSSGNKATFDLTVMVKDEIAPIINGPSSLDIFVDDALSLSSLIDQYYTISDEYDGSLPYTITTDNYTTNKDTLGTYNISFKATDSSSNITSKSVAITIYDDQSPVFTGVSSVKSKMSTPLTIDDILATQSVSDNYTSLSINDVTITDYFTTNESVVGLYDVILLVQDSSGNTASKTVTVEVVDDILPIISGPVTYVDSYTSNVTVEDIINLLSISDNVDELQMTNLSVIDDTLTNRTTETGTFSVTFEVIDHSGNKGVHQVEITLVDDIPPVIYVDSYIVNVGTNASFSNEDALKLLLSSNELTPGQYDIKTVYNEYEGNEEKAGSYLYRVAFTSEDGEVTEKEFVIKVTEEETFFDQYLTLRNILLYGASLLLLGLTIYKAKK